MVTDVVCPFCGTLCDHLEVEVGPRYALEDVSWCELVEVAVCASKEEVQGQALSKFAELVPIM